MSLNPTTAARLAQIDRVSEAFARAKRICDRLAPVPPLNLGSSGYGVTRESAERWFAADTRARDFRRDHADSIRARVLAKIERRDGVVSDADLLRLSKGQRAFARQRRAA